MSFLFSVDLKRFTSKIDPRKLAYAAQPDAASVGALSLCKNGQDSLYLKKSRASSCLVWDVKEPSQRTNKHFGMHTLVPVASCFLIYSCFLPFISASESSTSIAAIVDENNGATIHNVEDNERHNDTSNSL